MLAGRWKGRLVEALIGELATAVQAQLPGILMVRVTWDMIRQQKATAECPGQALRRHYTHLGYDTSARGYGRVSRSGSLT